MAAFLPKVLICFSSFLHCVGADEILRKSSSEGKKRSHDKKILSIQCALKVFKGLVSKVS